MHSFMRSEKLKKHLNCLYSKGSMYLNINQNLLYHASIPLDEDGQFKKIDIQGKEYSGKLFMNKVDRLIRAAYFEKEDAVNGWYELPVSPVQSTPAIAVSVCGSVTTFEQMGLQRVKIRPDTLIGTIAVGATGEIYYVEVTFNAGESNNAANEILKRIVSTMFNAREDGSGQEVLTGRIPYDTMRLIEAIDQNTGF